MSNEKSVGLKYATPTEFSKYCMFFLLRLHAYGVQEQRFLESFPALVCVRKTDLALVVRADTNKGGK